MADALFLRPGKVLLRDRGPSVSLRAARPGGGHDRGRQSRETGGGGHLRWRRPLASPAPGGVARFAVLPERRLRLDGHQQGPLANHRGRQDMAQSRAPAGRDFLRLLHGREDRFRGGHQEEGFQDRRWRPALAAHSGRRRASGRPRAQRLYLDRLRQPAVRNRHRLEHAAAARVAPARLGGPRSGDQAPRLPSPFLFPGDRRWGQDMENQLRLHFRRDHAGALASRTARA